MEHFDENVARRVWSRVQGKSDARDPRPERKEPDTLANLVLLTTQLWQNLSALSRGVKEKHRRQVQQLARQYQQRAMSLQGLCKLQQGKPVSIPPVQRQKLSPQQLCRSCIGDMQKLIKGCNAQPAGQFSTLFEGHCAQTRRDLELLLQVLAQL